MKTPQTMTIDLPPAPFSWRLQPLEMEARYPSVRCQATCTVKHPTGCFTYEAADVWFGLADFERFITELEGITRGTHPQARWNDLSEAFVLTIATHERKTTLALNVFEPSPDGAEIRLSMSTPVDNDLPAMLLGTLREQGRSWRLHLT